MNFQRGVLHNDGNSIDVSLALPGVDSRRSYNLDLLGNWVDNGLSGSAHAVESTHDCVADHQSRSTNTLNQVATLNGSSLSYDLKGNLTADAKLTYTYDAFNRLIAVSGTARTGIQPPPVMARNSNLWQNLFLNPRSPNR